MNRVCKINRTVLVMMTLAAVAIAFNAHAAWAQGISPVLWSDSAVSFDSGLAPSVAISGMLAVEVHEDGSGGLWYSTGQIQGGTVLWTASTKYTNGYAPSIAISGNTVIEVHQATAGEGALWNIDAAITSVDSITWAPATEYDTGLVAQWRRMD